MGKVILRRTMIKGHEWYKPENALAQLFCEMTRCSTLRAIWFPKLKAFGFEIEVLDEE